MFGKHNDKATALVTGATGAIGEAIARKIAASGCRVVITARDEGKAVATVERIMRDTGNRDVSYMMADLSVKNEIYDLQKMWKGPLNVLVNNAAATPRRRTETPQGIELQWATNVLGYFWMMDAFTPLLEEGKTSRIVNVASYWAGGLDLDDPEFKYRRYNNDSAYRQSKQADRMLTVAFARRLAGIGITVNACHPGDVNSKLSNDLGFGGHETPDEGAETPVWLSLSPQLEGVTGKYFARNRETSCEFGRDISKVERLYSICNGYL